MQPAVSALKNKPFLNILGWTAGHSVGARRKEQQWETAGWIWTVLQKRKDRLVSRDLLRTEVRIIHTTGPNLFCKLLFQLRSQISLNSSAPGACSHSRIYLPCCCWLVTKSCLTLCDPMNCSMLGFPVLPYILSLLMSHVSMPYLVTSDFPTIQTFVVIAFTYTLSAEPRYQIFSYFATQAIFTQQRTSEILKQMVNVSMISCVYL